MTNDDFLIALSQSFEAFIQSGTSRSTSKLKPLHGAIAKDIATKLGPTYSVVSQGYKEDKEDLIYGRYFEKRVDISVKKGIKSVTGIAVKFVVQNYSQNSNNYFENMLGETANIRCSDCPYFQIFIILDKLPYYNRDNEIIKWETFTGHNASKYVTLSNDDIDQNHHTPNKTLIYVISVPNDEKNIKTKEDYIDFYKNKQVQVDLSENEYGPFGNAVILNDYETFIDKVYHTIMAM